MSLNERSKPDHVIKLLNAMVMVIGSIEPVSIDSITKSPSMLYLFKPHYGENSTSCLFFQISIAVSNPEIWLVGLDHMTGRKPLLRFTSAAISCGFNITGKFRFHISISYIA